MCLCGKTPFAGVAEDKNQPVHARSHRAMATVFAVYVAGESADRARACFDEVSEEIDRIEQTFSRFRPMSELSRINRLAAAQPVVTDPEVFQLLTTALEISRRTAGIFDITVGPLTRAWGFANRQGHVPSSEELNAAMAVTGWENVVLDPEWRTVAFRRPGVELDLGAIAKGYAVDRVLELLRRADVCGAVDAGSSSMAATETHTGAQGWRVSVPHPADRRRAVSEIELGDRALSTSGTREQSFEAGGKSYSHLIDPRNASATVAWQQVTVLAPTSTLADALSSAMHVLGPDEGSTVLAQMDACAALWVREADDGTECRDYRWPGRICCGNDKESKGTWTDANS